MGDEILEIRRVEKAGGLHAATASHGAGLPRRRRAKANVHVGYSVLLRFGRLTARLQLRGEGAFLFPSDDGHSNIQAQRLRLRQILLRRARTPRRRGGVAASCAHWPQNRQTHPAV